ncbi:hypothetical protein S7335_570 [Synechococcus sp. PCC 7335]|uniref:L-dopachrome tautomerase-related protein n=1 Tax=Synechococcus sp. (strain ATCC 29403 / PCC 7335) TaxID=91464 RepID=UPI00017EC089|nr:L-dopachrome tautomerase-related protein [Synechococcus sp. PCC 7335]EDX83353.1 hypothetical protein S7335_533 [Synechococcus sp. PCC 7335]EDX83390.1 hypothetical protein S7335_570 [Synechococcus sp. PCC 7335]
MRNQALLFTLLFVFGFASSSYSQTPQDAVLEIPANPLAAQAADDESVDTQVGQVEIVAELDIMPGNVTVSQDGRIFATVHGRGRGDAQLIEVTGRTTWEAFPNEAWNAPPGSGSDVLHTPHGVVIDSRDRLWVIDHGNWLPEAQRPKLLSFDINTRELLYRYDFDETEAPGQFPQGQFMQDLAVDAERGFVYIADSSAQRPAIVAVDINQNTVRRFENHPSFLNEDRVVVMVEGEVWTVTTPDGRSFPAGSPMNPITLSADGETLFFGAVRGLTWYSLPTQLLRNGASDQEIGEAIEVAGSKPVTDGVSTDAEGNHFFTNVAANAVDMLSPDGRTVRLAQDPRFLWLDSVRFGPDSWLYASVNQLHRAPNFNNGESQVELPFLIARIWTGTEGQVGR